MANIQRHRYGPSNVRVMNVLAATVIEIGDMCWYDATTDTVKPAKDFIGATDLATTQTAFKKVFCGVARSAHPAGNIVITTVTVITGPTSTVEYPCTTTSGNAAAAQSFDLGTFVGPAATTVVNYALAGTLSNQLVAPVATAILAIGKPDRVYVSALSIYVTLDSTIHHSGIQTVT